MFGLFKKRIADVPDVPLPELRRRANILVIDDDENSFPFELLEKEGYRITHWPTVKNLSDLTDGVYEIIFLDIQGVGQEYSAEDGLGILEHIKDRNPGQIVVAFSAYSYDLSKTQFWKMADDSLAKPVDVAKCKALIDRLLETSVKPDHYWQTIARILEQQGLTHRQIREIEHHVAKAIRRGDDSAAVDAVKAVVNNAQIVSQVVGLIARIVTIFSGLR